MLDAILQTDMAQHKSTIDSATAAANAAELAAANASLLGGSPSFYAASTAAAVAAAGGGVAGALPLPILRSPEQAARPPQIAYRPDVHEDRQRLVALLLHAADLHSAVQAPALDRRLAQQVAAEFKAQAEAEKRHGLKVTVMDGSTPLALASMVRRRKSPWFPTGLG